MDIKQIIEMELENFILWYTHDNEHPMFKDLDMYLKDVALDNYDEEKEK